MYWIVRADKFWYKFDDIDKAISHYNYIIDNINYKYKQIEQVYLAQYGGNFPRILKVWNRVTEEE